MGASDKDACALAGITKTTYYNWQASAEKGNKDMIAFFDPLKRAKAESRLASVMRIKKAGQDGNWQADAWLLERHDPESWARRTYAKIEGLDELLELAKSKGIQASELFNAMIAELSSADSDNS